MFVILNGPLGIGKSTLAEALSESMDQCAMLDGDALVALNPPPYEEARHLHGAIELLVNHHRSFGYRHFVVDHLWTSPVELEDLCGRLQALDPDAPIRCFLLTSSEEENLRRIRRRGEARAMADVESEERVARLERRALADADSDALGEPLDVSGSPSEVVAAIQRRLGVSG